MRVMCHADLTYNWNASNERSVDMNVTLPSFARHNQSLFVHVCINKVGYTLNSSAEDYDPLAAYCLATQWTQFMLARKVLSVGGRMLCWLDTSHWFEFCIF